MRKILSAIIIDPNKSKHDYKSIKSFQYYTKSETDFDLKVLEGSENILKEMSKFRGFDSLITIGEDINFKILNDLPFEFRKKWVHFDNFDAEAISNTIISTFKYNIGRSNGDNILFSIFTSTYNTPEIYIRRLYNSLLRQTYKNWNWWIIDDSDKETTLRYLNNLNDPRINIIKNVNRHGNIGFNKHMIASVADGDFLVEVDHDDEITDNCLQSIYDAYLVYPDVDFFYSMGMEELDGEPIYYGDNFALGLGDYKPYDVNGKTYTIPTTPDVNALSVRHIVGLPNHVRCWKKEFYHKIGGHNTDLSVLDDMDLLIRTFLKGKMCKINRCLYIQHEGTAKTGSGRGTTTTASRLPEIQRIGVYLKNRYDKEINERINELGLVDFYWKEDGEYSDISIGPVDGLDSINETFE